MAHALLPRLVRELVDLDAALAATWRTETSWRRPSIVARTMLCGLLEPRLLVRMSVMPAHSSTARTGAAGDDAGTGRGRLEQHPPGAVVDRSSRAGSSTPVRGTSTMLRLAASTALRTASDTSFALPVANADLALAVAHRHERVEREPPAALHDLGHAVDGDDVLDELVAIALALAVAAATTAATAAASPPRRRRHRRRRHAAGAARPRDARSFPSLREPRLPPLFVSHLELQSAFARAVGDRLHAAMVPVTGAVEHDLGDAGSLCLLGEQLPVALARATLPAPSCCPRPRSRRSRRGASRPGRRSRAGRRCASASGRPPGAAARPCRPPACAPGGAGGSGGHSRVFGA